MSLGTDACKRCEAHPDKVCFVHLMERELPPEQRLEALHEQLSSLSAERLKLRERVRLQRKVYWVLREVIDAIADETCCESQGCNFDTPMCGTMAARAARVEVDELIQPEKKNARRKGKLLQVQLGAVRLSRREGGARLGKQAMPVLPSRDVPPHNPASLGARRS